MKNWCERIIEYGTYLVVFATPIFYFGGSFFIPYVSSKVFSFYFLVEIIFVAWLYLIISDNKYRLSKKNWLFFTPLIIFITWLTITGILGVRLEMSFWSSLSRGTGLISLYHGLALSLVIASIIKNNLNYIKTLLLWFISGSFIITLSVWCGNEGLNLPLEFLQKSKGGGLIGNSSLAAAYLIFSVFFSLFLISIKEVNYRVKAWIVCAIFTVISSPLFLNLYGLFANHKLFISAKGAMLGIGIGLIVLTLGFLSLSKNKIIRYITISGLFISMVFMAVGWKSLITPNTFIHQKFVASATESRFIFWQIAERGIKERPLMGWGGENYSVVYQKYFDPKILTLSSTTAEVWNDRAHNVFFEVGVAGGWPAIIFYVIFLSSLYYGIFLSHIVGKISRLQAGILWGLITAYVCQNLFVFDSISSILGLFILVGIIFGLNIISGIEKTDKFILKEKWRSYLAAGLIIILILSEIVFVFLPCYKVRTISKVVTLSLNKRPDHYKDLLNISPVGDGREIGGIAEDAYILYSKNIDQIRKDPKLLMYSKVDLEKFLAYLEIIAKKEPYDYRLYLNLARLYNIFVDLGGNLSLIQRVSEIRDHLIRLSPDDPQLKALSR